MAAVLSRTRSRGGCVALPPFGCRLLCASPAVHLLPRVTAAGLFSVFSVHHKLGMMIYNRHARELATKGRALSPPFYILLYGYILGEIRTGSPNDAIS